MSTGYTLIALEWPDGKKRRYPVYLKKGTSHRVEKTGWRRLLNITRSLKRGGWDYHIRYYFANKWAFAVIEWPVQRKERWALDRIRYWFSDSRLKRERAWR